MEIQWVCVILMEMYSENGHKKTKKRGFVPGFRKNIFIETFIKLVTFLF